MRVLFATDLHGIKWKYERMFKVANDFQADLVINGGDMLPPTGVPDKQGDFITNYLDTHFAQFDSTQIYYLCFLGNDDFRIFDQLMDETCNMYDYVVCLAQRKVEVGEYEFAGMNWIVDYPFRLKDRCRRDTEDFIFPEQFGTGVLSTPKGWQELDDWFAYAQTLPTLEDELNRLVRPSNMTNSVYVMHMPPRNLGLDQTTHGTQVGSKAIYDFLWKNQPKLSLHGHLHESPDVSGQWHAQLGKSICIQPGQLDREFIYVTIDLATMTFDRVIETLIGTYRGSFIISNSKPLDPT